jgi:tyrosyl-tRNA synthetase
MIHDIMPGTVELLSGGVTTGYVGFDPTSDSLHIGNLVSIMMLRHFQLAGHKPIALVGGATGMVGDPSGKNEERNLLDEETLRYNQECIKKQLLRFLDFDRNSVSNYAEIVNNYDWTKEYSLLAFLRDVGKHLTVNYMVAKDSVKKRLETGLSFTEFSYQLLQAYDFYHLFCTRNCRLQMGGSDQWGNITSGTELIRRIAGGEAFALTCPLITRSDGGKFGKTEEGNIWLDPVKTSPYRFYQFWLNVSDEDAENYIKIFTFLTKDTIEKLISDHRKARHNRLLQQVLAREVTIMVHSDEDFRMACEASQILFGKGTTEALAKLDENTFLSVFEGVPIYEILLTDMENGIQLTELLSVRTRIFDSKSELRRMVSGGGLIINKLKAENPDEIIYSSKLINKKYILIQKGKKNYYLIKAV